MTKQMQTELSQTILTCAQEAVADAIETHRRMGRSIVVSENGQIKHIKAKDIPPRALPHDEWEKD
ncbi:MAG: hypothetical protein KY445_03850 [Armatimonadetes bacterium]|nr:hypothetical protein [Armatimonadota bacterium]